MTFFLDGPPPPTRPANKVPSKAPIAVPVTGARQAPEPSGLTGLPVAAPKAAPAVERQEQEVEAAAASPTATRSTATATAATDRDEDAAPADPAPSTTATATATAPAAPAADKNWRGPGPYCAATWAGTDTPCRGRARKGSDFCRTHQPEPTAAPAAAKEKHMPYRNGGTEIILDKLGAAAPELVPFDELVDAYPGRHREACRARLYALKTKGMVDGAVAGGWCLTKQGYAEKATAPKKKAAPAKKSTPAPTRPEPEEVADEETVAPSKVDKLNWLIDGLEGGFLDQAAFIEQVKALVQ